MTKTSHLLVGGAAGLALFGPWGFLLGALGGIAPDKDILLWGTENRKKSLWGHRGITHTLLFLTILTLLLYFGVEYGTKLFPQNPIFITLHGSLFSLLGAFAAGYLSHLLMDLLTPMGVPLWFPFNRHFASLKLVKTGSAGEYLLVLGGGLLFVLIYLKAMPWLGGKI